MAHGDTEWVMEFPAGWRYRRQMAVSDPPQHANEGACLVIKNLDSVDLRIGYVNKVTADGDAMEGETFRQTAVRALSEELGLGKDGVEIADLLPPAEGGGESFVLLQTPYADLERDLQATGVFAAKLSRRAARSVSFDKDVDEWKWVEQGELRDVDACTPEIAALNRVIRDKLWDAFPRKKGV